MRCTLLLCLMLAATGAAAAQAPEPGAAPISGPAFLDNMPATRAANLDDHVLRAMGERGLPGVAAAILKAKKGVRFFSPFDT